MGYHHNIVAGQRQVQLDGITVCLDGAFECGQGVLGIFSFEASMGNYLRCIGGWTVSGMSASWIWLLCTYSLSLGLVSLVVEGSFDGVLPCRWSL
jgi:hypothetical protein